MYIYLPNNNFSHALAAANAINQPTTKALQNLQLGELLAAKVESIKNGIVKLNIAGLQVQTQTKLPLTVGQRLPLQVMELGQHVTLKVLTTDSYAGQVMQRSLRQSLPLQNSMAPLLSNLKALSQLPNDVVKTPDNSKIMEHVQQLLKQLPNSKQVSTGKGLAQAIKNSGLFLENQLSDKQANNQTNLVKQDFKANLLKLQHALQQSTTVQSNSKNTAKTSNTTTTVNTPIVDSHEASEKNTTTTKLNTTLTTKQKTTLPPPLKGSLPKAQTIATKSLANLQNIAVIVDELIEQTQASLARVQLHQLASAPATVDTSSNPSWLFELPIKHQEEQHIVHMLIEQEDNSTNAEEEHVWQVKLALDLPNLGPIHVHLRLEHDNLSTILWAEAPATKQFVEDDMSFLRDSLENEGLNLKQLVCRLGTMNETPQPPPDNLVDTKA